MMKWRLLIITAGLLLPLYKLSAQQMTFKNVPPEVQAVLLQKFPEIHSGDLPQPVIDEILRVMGSYENLENARIEKNERSKISLIVDIKRLVGEIQIRGNNSIPESELVELLKIEKGQRFDRRRAIESAENLKQLYGERGYFNAVIDLSFEQLPEGDVNITLEIDEKNPCLIQNIAIDSENKELRDALNMRTKKFHRLNLTQENLDKMSRSLRSYFRSNSYMTASIREPQITYNEDKTKAVIHLDTQDPFKWQFNVVGNKQRSLAEIYKILDLYDLERTNLDPVAEAIDRLRSDYLKSAFPHASIKGRVDEFNEQFVKRVFLEIHEGPKVAIERYEIEGRISRPEQYYPTFIKNHSSRVLDQGYYNREDLEVGLNNLIIHLKNQGFLRARVQSLRVEFSEDKSKAKVFINIDEGSLTQIRAINFDGNNFFSARELISVFGLDTRAPLKLIELENGIEKIKAFYQRQGFMEMKVLNEDETLVLYNDKGTLAEVNFKLYEGPRVRVADIVIEGHTFTKEDVIRREVDLKIGQVLTPRIIEEATDRLNRLGTFSRVGIRTLEENSSIAERTVIVSVAERDPGTFRMGAGINSERDLTGRGFIGLGYNNIGGTARAVSARAEMNYNIAQINYPEHELTLGYLEPFILNTRNKGRVNLTRSERVFSYDSAFRGLTSVTLSERADFLVERQFNKAFRGTFRVWGIDRRKDFEADGRCLEDPDNNNQPNPDKRCPSTTQQIGKIGPIIDLDYRDNPFMPTSGSFSRGIFEYSDPVLGSTEGIHFWKADTQYTKYIRLGSPRLVWANSIRGGYLKNLDGRPGSGIPANQAFFLGGIFTVRGFDSANNRERIPPEDELPIVRSTAIVVSDYSYYGLFKSELRFPISGDHGGVIFYDGGLVQVEGEIRGEEVNISRPYRDSVGIGYRYNTPVGPVSLDLAFKINPRGEIRNALGELVRSKEDAFRVHFSIGTF
jgi:outer membrane protein insertion porin family